MQGTRLLFCLFIGFSQCFGNGHNPDENANENLFEGDIILNSHQRQAIELGRDLDGTLFTRGATAQSSLLWPNGVVPYTIDETIFGFIAVIPAASGISCYLKDCMYYPDGEPYCRYGELVDCPEEEDDKCGTLSFTLGSNYRGKVWNCTRSTHDDCNEEEICDHMRDVAADIDDTIESCSVTCCDGDGCNHQGKKKSTLMKLVGKKKDKAVKNIRQTFHWPQ